MIHTSGENGRVYEVSIYNKVVRALVKENRSHSHFEDRWADCQVQDVMARDEAEARKLLKNRFPPEDGFVIDSLVPVAG